ncbi:hypothetical protein BDW68DRAFT_165649 [Aspergillus falconensis]
MNVGCRGPSGHLRASRWIWVHHTLCLGLCIYRVVYSLLYIRTTSPSYLTRAMTEAVLVNGG